MMYIDNEVLEKMIMTIVEGFDRIEKKLDTKKLPTPIAGSRTVSG